MLRSSLVSFLLFITVVLGGIWYVYAYHHDDIFRLIGAREEFPLFIGEAFFAVTVADTPEERQRGLSGTRALADQTGLLFIFDEPGRYGMWMKDMNYAIDIIWIDDRLRIVHTEENVTPESYPKVFGSPQIARFVLEVPAFSVESFKLEVGQNVSIPPELLPADLQR